MRLGVAKREIVETSGGSVGQFWTPAATAKSFVEWAGVKPGMRVLDAGSGGGALTRAALRAGASVIAIEVDRKWARVLERQNLPRCEVVCADFLKAPQISRLRVDLVLSNPPWEDDLVELFARRALELAPSVSLIAPLNILCGSGRAESLWTPVLCDRLWPQANRPKFQGTKNGMRDVAFFDLSLRPEVCTQRQYFTALTVGR